MSWVHTISASLTSTASVKFLSCTAGAGLVATYGCMMVGGVLLPKIMVKSKGLFLYLLIK